MNQKDTGRIYSSGYKFKIGQTIHGGGIHTISIRDNANKSVATYWADRKCWDDYTAGSGVAVKTNGSFAEFVKWLDNHEKQETFAKGDAFIKASKGTSNTDKRLTVNLAKPRKLLPYIASIGKLMVASSFVIFSIIGAFSLAGIFFDSLKVSGDASSVFIKCLTAGCLMMIPALIEKELDK
jgi:hypothetical protein